MSKGIAKGPLYFFQRPNSTVTKTVVSDIEAEKKRLADAQAASIEQLNTLAKKCQEDAGEEMAFLFEPHFSSFFFPSKGTLYNQGVFAFRVFGDEFSIITKNGYCG